MVLISVNITHSLYGTVPVPVPYPVFLSAILYNNKRKSAFVKVNRNGW
jgi:hypothetical protein